MNYKYCNKLIPFILFLLMVSSSGFSETIKLELSEKKYGTSNVPVELIFPEKPIKKPVPLIILQHGSTRDSGKISNGIVQTDVQMKNLSKASLNNGFAVAIIDAFYKKNLKANQKKKQPDAQVYAKQIASYFSKNTKLDPNNFFYAGFSYGGRAALMLMNDLEFGNSKKWAGVVSLEPPCNMFYKPRNFETPLLVIKGGESHYEPKPCKTMIDLYSSAGADANLKIFPKSNHFFSHNGKIVKGVAFNGCGDNPVIISKNNNFNFLDGSVANPKNIRKKCFTKTSGSGKTREDLKLVIDASISFFKSKLN
ncbi:dienelactone hydrolase family protein [Alphaproteobacteria bacterium]|nr:dienelactone hydrolase family protein [Alphaproteobacteria bacterium]